MGDLTAALAWIPIAFSANRSTRTATDPEQILVPTAIIEQAAKLSSVREHMELLTDAYRRTTVDGIQRLCRPRNRANMNK
jgi:hypothetical protein